MIASYYELKTSEMHLIKTERPQEVIQKSLHGLMTDLGLGMFCPKKSVVLRQNILQR